MSTSDTGNGLPRGGSGSPFFSASMSRRIENRAQIASKIAATPNDMTAALTPCPELPLLFNGFEIPPNWARSLGSGIEKRNTASEIELGRAIVRCCQPAGGQSSERSVSAAFLRFHVPDSKFPFGTAERRQDIGKPTCAAVIAEVEDS